MYRKTEDFLNDWSRVNAGTLEVLNAVTDEKLDQAIVEGHSTLGWLGWHLVYSIPFFAKILGFDVSAPGDRNIVPKKASEIADAYRNVAGQFAEKVKKTITDDKLQDTVEFRGSMPVGALLRIVIEHEIHHRGQMTVLLRQAGLKVPGVMGPTKEEREQQ